MTQRSASQERRFSREAGNTSFAGGRTTTRSIAAVSDIQGESGRSDRIGGVQRRLVSATVSGDSDLKAESGGKWRAEDEESENYTYAMAL
ncbi:hypothetical protein OCK02_09170 [Rhizobium sp. TRM96647]|uniref:hypothetical protein n=1 Tax=unclassified Rhizobium TaxID=2613769 RepID=UPI0021E862A1|nr:MULTISPECIES: hypothetical protein [unclassified Rhizobium]MCV3736374.1 hypothetical protein [Rhizobium sp. TRM96647]MCV3758743.1 hypothetical protein [Rhizobium sp. TRM96650]